MPGLPTLGAGVRAVSPGRLSSGERSNPPPPRRQPVPTPPAPTPRRGGHAANNAANQSQNAAMIPTCPRSSRIIPCRPIDVSGRDVVWSDSSPCPAGAASGAPSSVDPLDQVAIHTRPWSARESGPVTDVKSGCLHLRDDACLDSLRGEAPPRRYPSTRSSAAKQERASPRSAPC